MQTKEYYSTYAFVSLQVWVGEGRGRAYRVDSEYSIYFSTFATGACKPHTLPNTDYVEAIYVLMTLGLQGPVVKYAVYTYVQKA